MHDRSRVFVLAPLLPLVLALAPVAREEASFAPLDERRSARVTLRRPIESSLDLPLVEPHVAAHPADARHLLVSAMVVTDVATPYESSRLVSFVSRDGGETWRETLHDWWGYDPWSAIAPSGETAMSWIGTRGSFQHRFPVRLFASDDGGRTWSETVQEAAGNYDGTKIAVLGDTFWFTTVRFGANHGADVILYRRDGGGPFVETARIDGGGRRLNFCEPAPLADGTVLVPASDYLERAWVHAWDPERAELSERRDVTTNPGGGRGYMRLVADASPGSPYRDHAYFVRATGGSAGGVWLNRSVDGGRTWGPDRRIDRFESSESWATLATPAVNADGALAIAWVDRREPPVGQENDVYVALSLDGGATLQRPVRVTRTSSDPRTDRNADVANRFPGGGHYMGLAARADGAFQLVWSDSRDGVFALRTARVVIAADGGPK